MTIREGMQRVLGVAKFIGVSLLRMGFFILMTVIAMGLAALL